MFAFIIISLSITVNYRERFAIANLALNFQKLSIWDSLMGSKILRQWLLWLVLCKCYIVNYSWHRYLRTNRELCAIMNYRIIFKWRWWWWVRERTQWVICTHENFIGSFFGHAEYFTIQLKSKRFEFVREAQIGWKKTLKSNYRRGEFALKSAALGAVKLINSFEDSLY